jgi:hypothetical protein
VIEIGRVVRVLGVALTETRYGTESWFHVGQIGDLQVTLGHPAPDRPRPLLVNPWSVYVEARIDDVRIQLVAHRDSMAAAEAAAEAALQHVPALAAQVEAARKSQEGRAA